MYSLNDNIVSLATIPGKAALNVIRLSGNDDLFFLYKKLTHKKKKPRPNFNHLCNIYNQTKVLDQAMCVFYRSPKSFTSENMLEISTHGGKIIVNQIISLILDLGARQASPGEFTYRAFINKKVDLVQAEAINNAVLATNQINSFYHIDAIKGGLSKELKKTQTIIKNTLTIIEHELDFNEDEINFIKKETIEKKLAQIYKNICSVLNSSFFEETSSHIRVAIVGFPNSGKSSLFNLIIGDDRAIVSKIKGTTRDTIEGNIIYKNTDFTLVDTAGIRKTKNKIELLGINKTIQEIQKASIVVCIDEKDPLKIKKRMQAHIKDKPCLLILNKIDLNPSHSSSKNIKVSCKTKEGIKRLLTQLSTTIEKNINEYFQKYSLFINKRQHSLLLSLKQQTKRTQKNYGEGDAAVLASDLRGLLDLFNGLFKPTNNEEIINTIFKDFCVGK